MRTRILPAIWLCLVSVAFAQTSDDPIQKELDSKNFERAIAIAESHDEPDPLFGRIALAQFDAGDKSSAKQTMRRIQDASSLANAADQLQAAGGGTGADFQSLINLITSTVAPNTWDDVGGPGAIVEFPGGVFVDAKGVLQKTRRTDRANGAKLAKTRQAIESKLAANQAATNHADANTRLRMISLPRLQREIQLRVALGEELTQEMRFLGGLKRIDYLFIFPETNDVVLAGPAHDVPIEELANADEQTQPLLLNDLLSLLENAETNGGILGCSITPKRANLARTKRFLATPTGPLKPRQTKKWVGEIRDQLGLQDIQVNGVDPRSHVARILVEADYHMKLVGMGLEPSIPEVPGYLASIKKASIPKTMDVLRWWFTLKTDAVRRNENKDSFEFPEQVVQLQSENELITDDGRRVHTGDSKDLNKQFAQRFTDHFGELAQQHPIYQQLDNVFRMALVSTLVHSDAVQSQVDWDPRWLTATLKAAVGRVPAEVSSIVNHRVIDRRHVIVGVSGGVRIRAGDAVRYAKSVSDVASCKKSQQLAKPQVARTSEKWYWDAERR